MPLAEIRGILKPPFVAAITQLDDLHQDAKKLATSEWAHVRSVATADSFNKKACEVHSGM
jgi:hypothetical protein